MDPLTALGLSANISQFVGYAIKLVSASTNIKNSATGCTSQVAMLDEVYTELSKLSSRLGSSNISTNVGIIRSPYAVEHIDAISKLSRTCKQDCNRLLNVTTELKSKNHITNKRTSFLIALKTIWKKGELDEIEKRLHSTQSVLTPHVCSLTSTLQDNYYRQLEKMHTMNQDMNMQQSERLTALKSSVQDLNQHVTAMLQNQQIGRSSSADIIDLENRMSQLSLSKSAIAKEYVILKSLSFESRPARYHSIQEAHKRTFEWVFQDTYDPNSDSNTSSILKWLREGDGIFWVSGKPGSGKSTLMKFISDDRRALEALSVWSGPLPVVIATHFFWSAGTSMQKSRQGLLQTLLFEIFRQQPNLIEPSCIERWQNISRNIKLMSWGTPELLRILDRIAHFDRLSSKFCFFIDGLDEYEGDHGKFCQALSRLSNSPHIKLCVSSRPWNAFEGSFGQDISSKLYIHDLTQGDIRTYVQESLESHPRWNEMASGVKTASDLINEVTRRAAGVFLWVYLVIRELRNGLTEYDSLWGLQRRLENVPDDLRDFFHQILGSVDSFYREKMARILQIALTLEEPASTLIYICHEIEYENEDYVLGCFPDARAREEFNKPEIFRHRLNASCRGLLEVNSHNGVVEFFHRTVMDFMRTKKMTAYLDRNVGTAFNPHLSLLKAFTGKLKFLVTPRSRVYADETELALVKDVLVHAKPVDKDMTAHYVLEELERYIREVEGSLNQPWSLGFCTITRRMIVESSLVGYIDYALHKYPNYLPKFGRPIMVEVIEFWGINPGHKSNTDGTIEMLRYFLECGHDPNEEYIIDSSTKTPWGHIFYDVIFFGVPEVFVQWLQSGLLSLMLKHGANPNIHFFSWAGVLPWTAFAHKLFIIPLSLQNKNASLTLLGDFANACISDSEARPPGPKPDVKGLEEELSKNFERIGQNSRSTDLMFFAAVSEKLLQMAKIYRVEISCFLPIVEKTFPPHLLRNLRNNVFNDHTNNLIPTMSDIRPRSLKRGPTDFQDDQLVHKKGRSGESATTDES
ncbi:hypothetical protein M426DRAFT_17699 [Hypoxylon sp. CI-4A]|nr:hypothetical protein M426DRAFT_17699 [Hypoxylon sp. CI-4A]